LLPRFTLFVDTVVVVVVVPDVYDLVVVWLLRYVIVCLPVLLVGLRLVVVCCFGWLLLPVVTAFTLLRLRLLFGYVVLPTVAGYALLRCCWLLLLLLLHAVVAFWLRLFPVGCCTFAVGCYVYVVYV